MASHSGFWLGGCLSGHMGTPLGTGPQVMAFLPALLSLLGRLPTTPS